MRLYSYDSKQAEQVVESKNGEDYLLVSLSPRVFKDRDTRRCVTGKEWGADETSGRAETLVSPTINGQA